MKRRSDFPLLYAMILCAALLLTLFGATIYERISLRREENFALRSTLAYVQTRLAAADSVGGVKLGQGPEGAALLLPEGDSGYETRIYLSEGMLREELTLSGGPYNPDFANAVTEAESFEVKRSGSLLRISVNGRAAYAALRSEGGQDHE